MMVQAGLLTTRRFWRVASTMNYWNVFSIVIVFGSMFLEFLSLSGAAIPLTKRKTKDLDELAGYAN